MMQLGKVVKSNSHCDYVVQVDDRLDRQDAPQPDDYGFGSFVKLVDPGDRLWAVGVIYNSQLMNPTFLSNGPRLSSEPDPIFTPDLLNENRTLLGVVLVGCMETQASQSWGVQGIPRVVVPIDTTVHTMNPAEVHQFHRDAEGRPQFTYFSHLLHCGGQFSNSLVQQVLKELIDSELFSGSDRRALEILHREMSWKNTMGAMR